AAHREEPAAALLVDLPGELQRVIHVGLVALHHPLADVAAGRQLHAADLDAAVGGVHSELALQLEVLRLAAAPDDEGVLRHLLVRRALPDDRAVLGAPELRIAVPALERRPVEDRLEAGVLVEDERIGAAHAAAAAAASLSLPRRRRLREE